jgi:hypothetical protein
MSKTEREKFINKAIILADRDLGRIQLVLDYKTKSVDDPAPDYEEVVNKFYGQAIEAMLKVGWSRKASDISDEDLQWVAAWHEERKVLLKRIAFYERKLGIDRQTYNIRGDLIGGRYKY